VATARNMYLAFGLITKTNNWKLVTFDTEIDHKSAYTFV